MRLLLAGAVLGLLGLASCATVPGGSCPVVALASAPVELHANLLFLDAAIDGLPVRLLVDTGAERTTLTEPAVTRLGLARDPRSITRMRGIGDITTSFDAKTHTLMLGNGQVSGLNMTVGRFATDDIAGMAFDGLLGTDILASFDVEIDPGARRLTLYQPRTCLDPAPPWTPEVTIEATGPPRGRMLVPIAVNGVGVVAILDTGAQVTTVSERFSARAGVSAAELAQDPRGLVKGASPNTVTARRHRFRDLQVGPTLVPGPALAVLAMDGQSTDALLGADYLAGRKLWLSFASRRIFLARR